MKYCIKIKKPQGGFQIVPFETHQERNDWLRANGYYETGGIFRHLNGNRAGLFTKVLDQAKIAQTCDTQIKRTTAWGFLWKK